MSRRYWVVVAMVVAAIALIVSMRWGDSSRTANNRPDGVASNDNTMGWSSSLPVANSAAPHGVSMLVNAERSAEIRRRLVELSAAIGVDAGTAGTPSAQLAALAPGRLTEDIDAYAGFIHEHIEHDFAPMAKGCYQDLLRRKPTAGGEVIVGFTILGDPSVGGVVDSADVRKESTLRVPALETCLRESFLAIYFDPPPKGAQISMRLPFHFEGGNVDTSHEIHLMDKRD